MTTPAAGWYPDPAGSGGTRWWDGVAWGHQVQPAAQPVATPGQQWGGGQQWYGGQQWDGGQTGQPWTTGAPSQQWTGQQAQQPPLGFAQRNKNSLIVVLIGVLYVVLATTLHLVVLGFLPVLFGVRAVQAKERLAWPAVGIAAAVLIFALLNFVG
jgi:hypothetical protein